MNVIYLLILILTVFGCFPLGVILYKRALVKNILAAGSAAKAEVYNVYKPVRSPSVEIVYYQFLTDEGAQVTGNLTAKKGAYKTGDYIDVYYLPGKPKRNAVKGASSFDGWLLFTIVFALLMLFAAYKLWQMSPSLSIEK